MLDTFKIVDSLFFGKEEVTGSILVEGSSFVPKYFVAPNNIRSVRGLVSQIIERPSERPTPIPEKLRFTSDA